MLSSNGGVPQLKALQKADALDQKRRRNKEQLKFASNTSAVAQPCDTGKNHMLIRHFSKTLTDRDVATTGLIRPLAEALQKLRDEGKLILSAPKAKMVIGCVIRLPQVLQKSYDEKGIVDSFVIPGITDKHCGAPDMDKLYNTYKIYYSVKEREKWDADMPDLVREVLSGTERISEEKFDSYGYPVDADRDGTEHSPSTSFTTQLSQQRAVISTRPKVMAEFCQHLFDGAANEREHRRLKDLEEARWRAKEL